MGTSYDLRKTHLVSLEGGGGAFGVGSCLHRKEKDGFHWGFSQTFIFFQRIFSLTFRGKTHIVQLGHIKNRAKISQIKKYFKTF